jgi:hypothetical protein
LNARLEPLSMKMLLSADARLEAVNTAACISGVEPQPLQESELMSTLRSQNSVSASVVRLHA